MEELLALRHYIEEGDYTAALDLVAELEEMSREDKLNKIYSFVVVLLIHLIKQKVEKRTTRSWDFSIYNSVQSIQRVNKRRRAGGFYACLEELETIIDDAFDTALKKAAMEALEGRFEEEDLLKMFDPTDVKTHALGLIGQDD